MNIDRVTNHLITLFKSDPVSVDFRARSTEITQEFDEDESFQAAIEATGADYGGRIAERMGAAVFTPELATAFRVGFILGAAAGIDSMTTWELD